MRILYGVVGEGMGHATRSRVVLEHLLQAGHQLHVVVSGRAHSFLTSAFQDRQGYGPGRIEITEIAGLHLVYDERGVDKSASLWSNLGNAPEGIAKNLAAYGAVARRLHPDLVISDFESWAYLFARNHDLPVISIDNMQVINRCRHSPDLKAGRGGLPALDYRIAKLSVKAKVPGAYHYLISSFFFPPVRKARTTLVPPILRPELLAARREPGDHLLVYQTAANNQALLPLLGRLPLPCRVYGMGTDRPDGLAESVSLRPFSQQGFIDDLRTARGVVAGGGFSLMGEAVHLQVPLLAIPLRKQFEQELNARYLDRLGYGRFNTEPTEDALIDFISELDTLSEGLAAYRPRDNSMLFGCLDELLGRVALGEPPPEALDHPNLGDRLSSRIAARLGESALGDDEDDVVGENGSDGDRAGTPGR